MQALRTKPASFRRPFAEKYAADQEAFFVDYALAHKKLAENGAKWGVGGPVALQEA